MQFDQGGVITTGSQDGEAVRQTLVVHHRPVGRVPGAAEQGRLESPITCTARVC